MSHVTAVPIAPIKRAWLAWLGAGVALAGIAGIGLAWAGTASVVGTPCSFADFPTGPKPARTATGLMFQTLAAGTGASPTDDDIALVGYRGALRGGAVFDQQPRAPLPVKGMIPGFSEALKLMHVGGRYRFCVPSQLGYGAKSPTPAIPANAPLIFDVQLQDFKSEAEVRAMQAQMQQMQAQGQLPPGAAPLPR